MSFPSLTTIINNAPLIIQAAGKLMDMIREKDKPAEPSTEPVDPIEELKMEVSDIQKQLEANDNANLKQVELIEALAKQNEALANTLNRMNQTIKISVTISALAIIIGLFALFKIYGH